MLEERLYDLINHAVLIQLSIVDTVSPVFQLNWEKFHIYKFSTKQLLNIKKCDHLIQ